MIRINLLGAPKPKSKKASASSMPSVDMGEVGSPLLKVNLLAMVGETINNTEAVWLNNVKDLGGSVDIEGMALSADAVANLISNLQKTGYFKNIEIKEAAQDETVKDMQAFQFSLTCEKAKS